jgi:flagellar basal body-associated protein FliL
MNINKKNIIFLLIIVAVILVGFVLIVFISRDRVGPGIIRLETSTEMKEKTAVAEIKNITEWYEAVGTVRPQVETRIEAQNFSSGD